ncbi:ABC transporter permease [Ornithinibacillus salinisoli]|uniref:ABC transporter permease n=1 Tax=Ornithinibacillus salinisoli TaxID=1848459 RepID=A0ABW4VVV0_9BACI
MIWQIVKKQGLVLLRNRQQLLLLVGLPIILISILGTALSNWVNGDNPDIQAKVAFIEHDHETEQVERFLTMLEKELPPEAVAAIEKEMGNLMFVSALKNEVFGSEELQEIIQLEEADPSQLAEIKNDNSYSAVIEVPENFTYELLEKMILDKEVDPIIHTSYNDTHQIGTSIVDSIVKQFQEQATLGMFLEENDVDQAVVQIDEEKIVSEVTSISQKNPISSKDYYSVGMAVMNVLFIASTIGSMAFLEKTTHVFDRVILANVSRWVYFIGIFLSGTIFGFMQLMIIYAFSWIAFGVVWPDMFAFFVVTLGFASAVGGITVLLTAISYRFNSEIITNFFSSIIVTIMAFLGGSFFPIGDFSPSIRMLGELTPNGAGMAAYLSILRGDGLTDNLQHLLLLIIFAIATIVIAACSFPKRGAIK